MGVDRCHVGKGMSSRGLLSRFWVLAAMAAALPCSATSSTRHNSSATSAALLAAAGKCNVNAVQDLVKSGASVNITNDTGETLLTLAASCSNPRLGLLLIRAGVHIDAQNKHGYTALMLSMLHQARPDLGLALVKAGAKVNVQNKIGSTALMFAARNHQSPDVALALIKSGAKMNVQAKDGSTALMLALRYQDSPDVALALVKAGANVNVQDEDGWSAIFYAAQYQQSPDVALALIKSGAKVNVQDEDGSTALMVAARNQQSPDVVLALIKSGAKVNVQAKHGSTALMLAAQNQQSPDVALALIKSGAKVNVQDQTGWTSLMYAAWYQQSPDVALALMRAGADVRLRTVAGEDAVIIAAQVGRSRLIEAMLHAGGEVNSCSKAGLSALFAAAMYGRMEAADLLLKEGADSLFRSAAGELPYEVARRRGHVQLADRLRKSTPHGFDLALQIARRPVTLASVGGGVLLGFAVGALIRCLSVRPRMVVKPADEEAVWLSAPPLESLPLGAVLMARQALAARNGKFHVYAKFAYRASEAVAAIVYPLGNSMLVVAPWALLLFYVAFFIIPGLAQHELETLARHPILSLVGSAPRGRLIGICDPRIPRLMGMLALLALYRAFLWECREDVEFLINADMRSHTSGILAGVLVHSGSWSMMNLAGASFACPASNRLNVHDAFNLYLSGAWWVTAAHVAFTLLDLVGICGASSTIAHEQEVIQLAEAIHEASTAKEVKAVGERFGIRVEPLEPVKYFPPGGVLLTLAAAFSDVCVLDIVGILNQLAAYQVKFAFTLTAIFTTSAFLEAKVLWQVDIRKEYSESIRRGFFTDHVAEYLSRERGLEAPLSLAVGVYAMPFALRSGLQFAQGLFSVALGLYGIAEFVTQIVDMKASADEEMRTGAAEPLQQPVISTATETPARSASHDAA